MEEDKQNIEAFKLAQQALTKEIHSTGRSKKYPARVQLCLVDPSSTPPLYVVKISAGGEESQFDVCITSQELESPQSIGGEVGKLFTTRGLEFLENTMKDAINMVNQHFTQDEIEYYRMCTILNLSNGDTEEEALDKDQEEDLEGLI